MNETIMPTGLTFLTGFAFVIVANIDGLTMQSFQYGAIFVVLFAATGVGLKGIRATGPQQALAHLYGPQPDESPDLWAFCVSGNRRYLATL